MDLHGLECRKGVIGNGICIYNYIYISMPMTRSLEVILKDAFSRYKVGSKFRAYHLRRTVLYRERPTLVDVIEFLKNKEEAGLVVSFDMSPKSRVYVRVK